MLPCALALRDTRRESQGVAGQVDRRGAGVTRQSDEWPGGCASQSVSLRGPPIAKTGSNGMPTIQLRTAAVYLIHTIHDSL